MKQWELKRAQSNLELNEQNFNEVLNNISAFSNRIYVNKRLQNVILTEYTNVQKLYDDYADLVFLEDYLHTYKEISSYRIYTENQTLLENQFIQKTNQKILNSDWYKEAINKKGQIIWKYKADLLTREKYLSLNRSIWNPKGELIGVLVININPEIIQSTLVDKSIITYIVFDSQIIFSSQDKNFEKYNQILVNFLYQNDYSSTKMINMTFEKERVGVVAVDFYPHSFDSLKFEIINVIPIRLLIKTTRIIVLYTSLILVIILILFTITILSYNYYIDTRVSLVNEQLDGLLDNNFKISPSIGGNDEFEQIYNTIYNMSSDINDLIKQVSTKTTEKNILALQQSEISFKMLSNQINPHFLFNTLETIRMKAIASADKEVATMLKLLASLLRYNLSVKGQPVPLIKELDAVQNYLNIQHMRFGNRISYDIATMCDVQEIEILPLLIQPIVENSFCHGLEDKVSGGFIYILITNEIINDKKILSISVKDNGCGISEDTLEELRNKLKNYKNQDTTKSIGLINVQSRIKMFYGSEFGITIESEIGEGTTVTLRIDTGA